MQRTKHRAELLFLLALLRQTQAKQAQERHVLEEAQSDDECWILCAEFVLAPGSMKMVVWWFAARGLVRRAMSERSTAAANFNMCRDTNESAD